MSGHDAQQLPGSLSNFVLSSYRCTYVPPQPHTCYVLEFLYFCTFVPARLNITCCSPHQIILHSALLSWWNQARSNAFCAPDIQAGANRSRWDPGAGGFTANSPSGLGLVCGLACRDTQVRGFPCPSTKAGKGSKQSHPMKQLNAGCSRSTTGSYGSFIELFTRPSYSLIINLSTKDHGFPQHILRQWFAVLLFIEFIAY